MKTLEKIADEIVYEDFTCPYCERQVPNFTFLTKTKCIWCDTNYHIKMLRIQK